MQLQPYIPEQEEEVIEQRQDTIAKGLREELLTQFLNGYKPDKNPPPKDVLGQYTLQLSQPLPQFSTPHSKAYAATDSENTARQLVAVVCSNLFPARVKLARQLMNNPHANIMPVMACGVVPLSRPEEERFVIVYERPQGKSLADIVNEQQRPLPDRFLRERIIGPLSSALEHLSTLGYCHGRINPNNVFFGEGVMLGDCASEPCGLSQDFHYEPIGRVQVAPDSGKGEGVIQNDFHALGAMVAWMKLKPPIFMDPERQRFCNKLMKEGAYLGLVGYRDVSEEMSDFLRGCLHDSPYERWTHKQAKQWAMGKRYNLLPPSISSAGSRAFPFNEANYLNLRSLSSAMHNNWALAVASIRDNSLARWVEVGMRRKDIGDSINRAVKSLGGGANRTEKQNAELVSRILTLMDPFSPMRMKQVSCYVDAIGTLLADAYERKDDAAIALIMDMVEQGLPSVWAECQRRYLGMDAEVPEALQGQLTALDRARINMRQTGIGFGIERVIYDLNPQLPCISPLLKGRHVTTLEGLLRALDELAPKLAAKEVPFDKHIAAFIGSQLSMTRDLSFTEFRGYPELQKNFALVGLKFLQQAQARSGNIKLPGLASWLVTSMTFIFETWQSQSIREHVCKVLKPMALKGHLGPILDMLTQYDYSLADKQGFLNASYSYHTMADEILSQQDEFRRDIRALHYGSMAAKGLAYFIFTVVVYYFVFEAS